MDAPTLVALHGSQVPVTAAQVVVGAAAWKAISTFDDPRALDALRAQSQPWSHLSPELAIITTMSLA